MRTDLELWEVDEHSYTIADLERRLAEVESRTH